MATILQALANSGWEANMPITRSANKPDPWLGLLLNHWNRCWLPDDRLGHRFATGSSCLPESREVGFDPPV